MQIWLLLSIIGFALAEDSSEKLTVNAGMVLTITQPYTGQYAHDFVNTMENMIQLVEYPDIHHDFNTPLAKIKVGITNRKINDLQFDVHKTNFTFHEDYSEIDLYVNQAVWDMDLKIRSDPEWIRDEGTGQLSFKDFYVRVTFDTIFENGNVMPRILDNSIDIQNFDAKFEGNTEILESLNIIMDHFKEFLKDELTKVVLDRFVTSLMQTMKDKILEMENSRVSIRDKIYFQDVSNSQNIFFNQALTDRFVQKEGFIALPLNGHFSYGSDNEEETSKLIELPAHYGKRDNLQGSMVQLIVSDGAIDSFLKSMYQSGDLTFKNSVQTSFVTQLINNFDEVFDTDYDEVKVKIEPHNTQPKIHFKDGLMFCESKIKFSVMNPLNPDIPALYLVGHTNFTISITINQKNLQLTGSIEAVDFDIEEFKALFVAEETTEDIQKKMKSILPIIKNVLNSSLSRGLKIPKIIGGEHDQLQFVDVSLLDNYIVLEADVKVPAKDYNKIPMEIKNYTFKFVM